jgi:hypothetical protein
MIGVKQARRQPKWSRRYRMRRMRGEGGREEKASFKY